MGIQTRVEKVTSVDLHSNVRVAFNLLSGHTVDVWDGKASLTEGSVQTDLCTSNVTCAAVKVSAQDDAASLLSQAEQALTEAGFSFETDGDGCPTATSRRRRLEETNATDANVTTITCPAPSGNTCGSYWPEEISRSLTCTKDSYTVSITDGDCGCYTESTMIVPDQSTCTLTMEDSYGDGWNGHSLRFSNYDAPSVGTVCSSASPYLEGACTDADGGITLQYGANTEVSFTLHQTFPMLVYKMDTASSCYYETNIVGTSEAVASDANIDGGVIAWRVDDTPAFTSTFSACAPSPPPPPLPPGHSMQYNVLYDVQVSGDIAAFNTAGYQSSLASYTGVSASDIAIETSTTTDIFTAVTRRRLSESFYVRATLSFDSETTANTVLAQLDDLSASDAATQFGISIIQVYTPQLEYLIDSGLSGDTGATE